MSPRTETSYQRIRDERREQILQAALKLFAYKGLRATKISDIAAAAGISQGLIHHYFSSKESLYTAVAERAMVGGLRAVNEPPNRRASPWERLVSSCESMLEGITKYPEYLLVIVQCLINDDIPPETRDLITQYGRSFFSNVVQLIREGQSAGQVAAGDPDELAVVLIATLQGLVLTQFTGRIFTDAARPRAETVLRLLKGGENTHARPD
jgi:AcrR family transcriptional regulator